MLNNVFKIVWLKLIQGHHKGHGLRCPREMALMPLSNTPFKHDEFQRCTRWNSSVWKVFADELPVNTDELLSKSYPPRPLLVNREFIGVQRWFAEKKSGLKGFPMNTDENADEV